MSRPRVGPLTGPGAAIESFRGIDSIAGIGRYKKNSMTVDEARRLTAWLMKDPNPPPSDLFPSLRNWSQSRMKLLKALERGIWTQARRMAGDKRSPGQADPVRKAMENAERMLFKAVLDVNRMDEREVSRRLRDLKVEQSAPVPGFRVKEDRDRKQRENWVPSAIAQETPVSRSSDMYRREKEIGREEKKRAKIRKGLVAYARSQSRMDSRGEKSTGIGIRRNTLGYVTRRYSGEMRHYMNELVSRLIDVLASGGSLDDYQRFVPKDRLTPLKLSLGAWRVIRDNVRREGFPFKVSYLDGGKRIKDRISIGFDGPSLLKAKSPEDLERTLITTSVGARKLENVAEAKALSALMKLEEKGLLQNMSREEIERVLQKAAMNALRQSTMTYLSRFMVPKSVTMVASDTDLVRRLVEASRRYNVDLLGIFSNIMSRLPAGSRIFDPSIRAYSYPTVERVIRDFFGFTKPRAKKGEKISRSILDYLEKEGKEANLMEIASASASRVYERAANLIRKREGRAVSAYGRTFRTLDDNTLDKVDRLDQTSLDMANQASSIRGYRTEGYGREFPLPIDPDDLTPEGQVQAYWLRHPGNPKQAGSRYVVSASALPGRERKQEANLMKALRKEVGFKDLRSRSLVKEMDRLMDMSFSYPGSVRLANGYTLVVPTEKEARLIWENLGAKAPKITLSPENVRKMDSVLLNVLMLSHPNAAVRVATAKRIGRSFNAALMVNDRERLSFFRRLFESLGEPFVTRTRRILDDRLEDPTEVKFWEPKWRKYARPNLDDEE